MNMIEAKLKLERSNRQCNFKSFANWSPYLIARISATTGLIEMKSFLLAAREIFKLGSFIAQSSETKPSLKTPASTCKKWQPFGIDSATGSTEPYFLRADL